MKSANILIFTGTKDFVRMTCVDCPVVLLLAIVSSCLGNTDNLLTRIEALELKDAKQSARIELLEEQAQISHERFHHLSMAYTDLQKELAEKSKTILEQENVITKLVDKEEMQMKPSLKSKIHEAGRNFNGTVKRASGSPVAFYAAHMKNDMQNPNYHDAVKFDDVILNEGNGYHYTRRQFIAPRSGIYFFSVSILSDAYSNSDSSVVKNGQELARVICWNTPDKQYDQGSVTIATHLVTGDEVWVRYELQDTGKIWGHGHTTFSGFLIE